MFSRGLSELVLIVEDVQPAAQLYRDVVGLLAERATSYYFYDPDGKLIEFWSPDDHCLAGER